MNDHTIPPTPTDTRPIGWWLAAIGPALRDRMRSTLEDAGVTRRQWRILTVLERGPATAEQLEDALPPKGRRRGDHRPDHSADGPHAGHDDAPTAPAAPAFGFGGRRGHRFGPFGRRGAGPAFCHGFGHGHGPHQHRPTPELLAGLADRGWVEQADDAWRLTALGAAEHDRILAKVTAVRSAVREGIDDDEWATAMSVLERVAANLRG